MVSDQRRPLHLGCRIRGPWHRGLAAIMVLVVVTVALLQVLLALQAWRLAGDEIAAYSSGEGQVITRLTLMAQMLTYLPFQVSSLDALAGAIAAAVAFALAAHRPDSDPESGWRRVSWAATFVAGVVGLLIALLIVFVQAHFVISMNDSIEAVFGPADMVSGLARVLAAGADGLLWGGALIVGLLWRADAWSLSSEGDLEHAGDELGLAQVDTTDPSEEAVTSPAVPTSAYARPVTGDPVPGPRLEADGSSDSGYDEFRFRR